MKHLFRHSLTVAAVAATLAACTANGKLQQYIENNNIRLAGKEIAPGMTCEGMTLDRDTVIVTYDFPAITVSEAELANRDIITANHRNLFLEGLSNDKTSDPDGARIIADADVYMKGVFKYANATFTVLIPPDELDAVLGE